MSSPSNKPINPFDVSAYAPKRAREQLTPAEIADEKGISDYFTPPGVSRGAETGSPSPSDGERAEGERERFIENFRVPRSLDPYVFEDPSEAVPPRRFRPLQIGIAAVAVLALGAPAGHYLWVEASMPRTGKSDSFGSRFDLPKSKIEERIAPSATPPARSQTLTVSPQAVTAPPAALTPVTAPAAAIPAPSVQPAISQSPAPQRSQNTQLDAERKLTPPPPVQSAPPARSAAAVPSAPAENRAMVRPVPPPAPPPVPKLDPEQVEILMKQGERFIADGDLVTARVVFRRAAEAGEARAALALGATYDPAMLAKLGARGMHGDIAQAREWYQKASDLGSAEARNRLELIAQRR